MIDRLSHEPLVNTPDNIDLIEAFTESLCGSRPPILVHELLAVEGNRVLMQPLDAGAEEGGKKDEEETASFGIGAMLEADSILGPDGYTIEAMLTRQCLGVLVA